MDTMTVLKTASHTLSRMNENLWLEKACCNLIPDLTLWIIEYAWSEGMMGVLEVLGPPLWLEGDWCLLSLEESCRMRVVAAEVWRIMQARDIKHFERVTKFLNVTYQLVPRLVVSIKHMKIMFGLQTLVIMWMLWNDESTANINEKIESLFPNNLSQYYKCSRRYVELMQKNIQDFKSFARVLARDRCKREAYIRDLLEDQYGERYAQKLEERLSQYLEELNKALPHPTHIEQVLKQSPPQGAGEKILKKFLTRDDASLASILKRLLNCAVTINLSLADSDSPDPREADVYKPSQETMHVICRPSQEDTKEDRLSQSSLKDLFISHGLWQRNKTVSQESSSLEICQNGRLIPSTQMSADYEIFHVGCSPSLLEEEEEKSERRCPLTETESEAKRNQERSEQMCSRHGKKMRSILQECSEELDGETVQTECIPTSHKGTPSPITYSQTTSSYHHNTSVSSHQDSSSTNISLSHIQEVLSNQQSVVASKSSEKSSPSVHTSSSSSLPQSSSSLQSISKPHNTSRISAGKTRDAAVQFMTTVVLKGHDVKLSLESQSFLMQSRLLQPQVCLYRLRTEECASVLNPRYIFNASMEEQESEDEKFLFFDPNTLYSDTYSESDSTDSDDPDFYPDGR